MKITIYRPKQIGGQVTRISTDKASVIIDLGRNLPNNRTQNDALAAEVDNITQGCSAVFYTHYHGDHIGLFHHVEANIPQYMGKVAKQVLCKKYEVLSLIPVEQQQTDYAYIKEKAALINTFEANEVFSFGDIKVTPYFVSHSAYDSYMFLIEAAGKRILHTGDFRGHGYLSKGSLPTIKMYIGQVDVLITEGTMLGRTDETILTEPMLCAKAIDLLKQHKYVFVLCSSTDMERLASFKNAHQEVCPHRPLVADVYQKDVLDIFTKSAGQKSECFDFGNVYAYKESNKKLHNWMLEHGFTMFIRANDQFGRLLDSLLPLIPADEPPLFIYSMWEGYMKNPHTIKEGYVQMEKRFTCSVHLHTSGHATIPVLKQVCQLVNPSTAIIPIHRDVDADFASVVDLSAKQKEKVINSSAVMNDIEIEFID